MSITLLKRHIRDRQALHLDIIKVELGRGFYIEAVNMDLFLAHEDEPGERARCGRVDAMHDGRWILTREWRIELTEMFGDLPTDIAIEGDEE